MNKRITLRTGFVFLILCIALLIKPAVAHADIEYTDSNYINPSWDTAITSVTYSETTEGKIAVKVGINAVAYKKGGQIMICSKENGKAEQESVSSESFSSSNDKYTLKRTFTPGSTIKLYAYNLGEEPLDDSEIPWLEDDFKLPQCAKNPLKDIITVSLSDKTKTYSGEFNNARSVNVYRLKAPDDAYLKVSDFRSSDSNGWLGLYYFEDEMKSLSSSHAYEYINSGSGDTIITGFAGKKGGGEYYLVMDAGAKGAEWSFKMQFRKYRHAYVEIKVKEGSLDGVFPQNTTLHVTATLEPSNTDAKFTSKSSVTAPGHNTGISKIKTSNKGKTATFTVQTAGDASETDYTINFSELNPESVSDFYGTTGTGMQKVFTVSTGLSAMKLSPEVSYNFIRFNSFNIPEYSGGGAADITVYLKVGKKWKKQFSVQAWSKNPKTITKLKSGKTYKYKTVISKKLKSGKTAKTTNIYKVKTGPKTAPAIKSIKVSGVKYKKTWVHGYFDSGWFWHPGNWSYYTTYTLTVKLKKAPKGAVGLEVNGMKMTGKGTTYKITSSTSGNAKGKSLKFTFRTVTSNTYGGYSKAVTKKVKLR